MCLGGGRVAPPAGCPAHVLAPIPRSPAAILFRRCKRFASSSLRRVAPGARRSSRLEPVRRPLVSKEMPCHPLELLRLWKPFSSRSCFHGAQIAHLGQLRAPHGHRPDVTPSLSVPVRNPVTPTTTARQLTTRPDGVDPPEAILSIVYANPMYFIITWLGRAFRHRLCVSPPDRVVRQSNVFHYYVARESIPASALRLPPDRVDGSTGAG
jgi:hypothetical protein